MGPEGKAVHTLVIFLVRCFCSHSLDTPYETTRNTRSARPILFFGVSQGTLGSALPMRMYIPPVLLAQTPLFPPASHLAWGGGTVEGVASDVPSLWGNRVE